MICDLLASRPISHITKKTLSDLHSTKIEQMNKTMVIFRRGAIFLCRIRCDPIPPQTSVQRFAHTRNVTTCCCLSHYRARLQASSCYSDSANWPGYEAVRDVLSVSIKVNNTGSVANVAERDFFNKGFCGCPLCFYI